MLSVVVAFALQASSPALITDGPIAAELWTTPPGQAIVLAPKTPYWQAPLDLDQATLSYHGYGGAIFHNASNLGLAAMPEARDDYSQRVGRLGPDCQQKAPLTALQKLAIRKLHETAVPKGDGVVWQYDYDAMSNDYIVKPPYPSAYAQATNLQALLFAYCKTKNADDLALAVKAGDGMLLPVSAGGVRNGDWFEEMPAPAGLAPYIMNGHLYSVLVLYQLAEATGQARFKAAAETGAAAFDRHLYDFDTGAWTRYDLRPKSSEIYLEVHYSPKTTISRIEVRSGDSVYRACDQRRCDISLSAARNDNSLRLGANLPSLRLYEPGEQVDVSIDYKGPAPSVYSGSARPDRSEIFLTSTGPTARLPIADLGWSTVDVGYQRWHAFLVEELWRRTGDPVHFVTAARWYNYLRLRDADTSTLRERERYFDRTPNAAEDRLIADCFKGVDPSKLDAARAAKQSCSLPAGWRSRLGV